MEPRAQLLQLLNDKEFLTGPALGNQLGISRAAVHKHVSALKQSGLPVESVRGKGYKLAPSIVPLNEYKILDQLGQGPRPQTGRVRVEQVVDSTNNVLRRTSKSANIHASVCVAEAQSTGRGRRANRWVASPYRNLLMSLGWIYDRRPPELATLAPAVGIAVLDVLADEGVAGLGIKWPNDIVHDCRKLGGILIDVSGEADGVCTLIIGIGINMDMTVQDGAHIDQAWTDLRNGMGCQVDRNRVVAALIRRLFVVLTDFMQSGFQPYRPRWTEVDALAGREVSVLMRDGGVPVRGTAHGIDSDGALKVRPYGGKEIRCTHGEVSVRVR